MADQDANQIEGLPEGSTVRALQPEGETAPPQPTGDKSGIEGLPEGATVRALASSDDKSQTSVQRGPDVPDKPKGILDTASDYWEKKAAPVDKTITGALAPDTSAGLLKTQAVEVPKTLGRELYSMGKTIAGMPSGIYHAFADPATEEEKAAQAPFEREHGEEPGTETSGMKRIGLAAGRMSGLSSAEEAAKMPTPTYEQALSVAPEALGQGAGTVVGGEMLGKGAKGINTKNLPTMEAAKNASIRGVGRVAGKVLDNPEIAGTIAGAAMGHGFGSVYLGSKIGRVLGKLGIDSSTVDPMRYKGLDVTVKNLDKVTTALEKATKDADKARDAHKAYSATIAEGGSAPEAVENAYLKAHEAQVEAQKHYDAAVRAVKAQATGMAPDQDITPEAVDAARPEPATPTKEQNDAKLSELMEKAAPTEKPAPVPQNVKTPGQIQPETFPQTPTEAPRVTMGKAELPGNQGTMGRNRMLTEGTPEAAPKAAEAPVASESPKPLLGEIMPPERPAKPGRLGTLRVNEGGKVIDTEPDIQQKIEEGLQGKAKPVAVPAPKLPEVNDKGQTMGFDFSPAEDIGRKVRGDEKGVPRTTERRAIPRTPEEQAATKSFSQARKELGDDASFEDIEARAKELRTATPKKFEEVLPKQGEDEHTPEEMTKVEQVVSQHTDQELARLGKKYGIDEKDYDFSKRDEKRHRVERDDFVNAILSKMPAKDVSNIARLSDEFNDKDSTLWSEAERSGLSKAQRSRAIMQEHEGLKTVSGGSGKFTGKFTDIDGNVKKLRFHEDERQLPFSTQTLEMLGNENTDWSKQPGNYGEQAKWFSEHPEDLENARKDVIASLKPQADAGNTSAKQSLDLVNKAKPASVHNYPKSYEDMTRDKESKAKETVGTKEGAEKDTDYMAQAKVNKPNGTLSEQVQEAQRLKDEGKKPVKSVAEKSADDFNKTQGRGPIKPVEPKAHPQGKEIADAYEAMKHDPTNPEVKKSYDSLKKGIDEQWDHATKQGFEFEPWDEEGQPYANSKEMKRDVDENKHLSFFRGVDMPADHPLAEVDPKTGLSYNEKFRAIHDLYGHAATGFEFGPKGEEGAYQTHAQMFDPEAIPALTSETRGQNNWTNNGAHLRNEAGEVIKKGEEGYIAPKDRPYAENKAGILPEEFHQGKEAPSAIAKLHNEGGGSTYNPTKGDMGGADAYAVPMHPELSKTIDSEKVTPEQIKKFMDDPKVKAAMEKDPTLSVGTWANEGKSYLDLSSAITDRDEAIAKGKENNQKAITYLKTREDIPTGGTGTGTPLEPKISKPEHASGEWTEYPNEKTKPYKDMTPEEQEDLASKGQSGASGKLPTGDALIKKYGESSGDPMDTTFILKDGRGVANTGTEHDQMLGGRATDKNPPREQFIDQGNIRVRPRPGLIGKREVSMSIPESGITPKQLDYIKKMSPQLRSGVVLLEVGKPGGAYRILDYNSATPEALESTLRELAPITPEGYPKGSPKVSGGSQGVTRTADGGTLDDHEIKLSAKQGDVANWLTSGLEGTFSEPDVLEDLNLKESPNTGKISDGKLVLPNHPAVLAEAIEKLGIQAQDMISDKDAPDYKESKAFAKQATLLEDSLRKSAGIPEDMEYYRIQKFLESKAKGVPLDEYGNPKVSGGSQAATSSAKLPEVAEKFGTEEEKAGITKSPAQTEKFISQMEKIPEVHEYTDIANAGAGARKWYQRSTKAFDSMAEEAPEYFKEEGDRDKFINLLAASSPRQSVAMNLRETLRTWKAYVDAGRPEGAPLKSLLDDNLTPATSKTPNALKALTGQEMWPDITKNKNFKVPSFARNLRGYLDSVTNDGWMSLFAGLDPREISSAHSYHPLSIATRAAADALGWEPAEAQAAIWSFTQALTERGEDLPEEVRKHSEDFVDLMQNDPQVRSLLSDLGVSHANLDAKLADIGAKPEVSSRTSPTTSRSVGRLKDRIEAARGKGAVPPSKSAQGELGFREAPAGESRSKLKDEDEGDTTFNPEEFGVGKDRPSTKMKRQYGRSQ
jgi:hypothetical protein